MTYIDISFEKGWENLVILDHVVQISFTDDGEQKTKPGHKIKSCNIFYRCRGEDFKVLYCHSDENEDNYEKGKRLWVNLKKLIAETKLDIKIIKLT